MEGISKDTNARLTYDGRRLNPLIRKGSGAWHQTGTLSENVLPASIAILISVLVATLRAQTSVENHPYPFSSSVSTSFVVRQPVDGCLLNSAVLG